MVKLKPYEFTIYFFLKRNSDKKFTVVKISENCVMNVRTARKYCNTLKRKKLIHRIKVRNKTSYYKFGKKPKKKK